MRHQDFFDSLVWDMHFRLIGLGHKISRAEAPQCCLGKAIACQGTYRENYNHTSLDEGGTNSSAPVSGVAPTILRSPSKSFSWSVGTPWHELLQTNFSVLYIPSFFAFPVKIGYCLSRGGFQCTVATSKTRAGCWGGPKNYRKFRPGDDRLPIRSILSLYCHWFYHHNLD